MSTITQQQTYVADTVHSSIGFEVPYAVATFSGTVNATISSSVNFSKP